MRTRKKKWTARELAENTMVLDTPESYAAYAAHHADDDRPLHLELGCGKGRFITQIAARHPAFRHVAVERDPTILAAAARLARETPELQNTPNAPVFLLAEATDLPSYFQPGIIRRLYINFCDPWPGKKKWAKRRLTHENFLAMYESLGIPAIFFKTDNRPLFEFSLNQFSERGWKLRNISLDLHAADEPPAPETVTEYEARFVALGAVIYRLEAYFETPPPREDI